jgi:hypothetical protein
MESNSLFGDHFLPKTNNGSKYSRKAGNGLKQVEINRIEEVVRYTAVSGNFEALLLQ